MSIVGVVPCGPMEVIVCRGSPPCPCIEIERIEVGEVALVFSLLDINRVPEVDIDMEVKCTYCGRVIPWKEGEK